MTGNIKKCFIIVFLFTSIVLIQPNLVKADSVGNSDATVEFYGKPDSKPGNNGTNSVTTQTASNISGSQLPLTGESNSLSSLSTIIGFTMLLGITFLLYKKRNKNI
ncbi:LPXTG cell wall anchor domain-containing protein [Companilactobacillus sp. DQM5]|uniref:LPXTG cell wall anchor domain-containing protein n=1 Tax=Companilactobacillus sp. DQM5 TaxID=3463359 RepID=UPI00405803F7